MDSSTSTGTRLVPSFSSFNLIIRGKETHAPEVARSRSGFSVFSAFATLVLLFLAPCLNSSALAQTPQPVTINFDGLATGAVVTNQYLQVKFSAMGFSAGPGGPNGYDLFTQNNAGLGSSPYNAIRGRYNPYYSPYSCSAGSYVYLDFPVPVKNFSFSMLNIYPNYYGYPYNTYFPYTAGFMDVYVNWYYYATYSISVPGQYRSPSTPLPVNFLSGIQNITGIAITDTINAAQPPNCGTIFFDDFTFTPDLAVGITNPRAVGYINGTTKNALLGADVILNASVFPSDRTGGTFSWTFTGPVSQPATTNSSSVVIKSTDVGTVTATVDYTLNGVTATGSVTINSMLPTLTSFTGQQGADQVFQPSTCINDPFTWYKLGCVTPAALAMSYATTVHAEPFISDPAQSGIKYVQAVSAFRKIARGAKLACHTKRTSDTNIASGWQLDTHDPFDPGGYPPHWFTEGNDLTMLSVDYPRAVLTFFSDWEFVDSINVDDHFEMYVVYFTGDNATSPGFQRTLGKLVWNWGGLVVFDWNGTNAVHTIRYSNAAPTSHTGVAANSMVTMQGNVYPPAEVACPGGPPISTNRIDTSRYFVRYHYKDFLGHEPDLPGWNFWTSQISQCIFDMNCVRAQRIHTGLAFMYSPEFIQQDPIMANPPGSPGFNASEYNPRFVHWCYETYLDRTPEAAGWQYWTSVLNSEGDYGHIIEAFQVCPEYRARFSLGL